MDPHPEENRKLPAAAMPNSAPPKRRKDNEGNAVVASDEVTDVAKSLGFQLGDRVEVKWTVADDEEERSHAGADAEAVNVKSVSVWWPATLRAMSNEFHTLTDEERNESANCTIPSTSVKVPIYQLCYSPLEELGYDSPSLEDVAFLSASRMLNLSSDEIMLFRKVGDPSPPSSPVPSDDEEDTAEFGNEESAIARDFSGPDEIRSYMNELMQQCLKKTGIDQKMNRMAASQKLIIAEKINRAKELLLEKIMNETDKIETGVKVITADMVKRCMAQMEGI